MARRRSRSTNRGLVPFVIALFVVVAIVSAARANPAAFTGVVVLIVAGGGFLWWRRRQAREREVEAARQAVEEAKRWWRELPFPTGAYTVTLTSVRRADERLYGFLSNLAENTAAELPDADVVIQRAEHIGPQPIVIGVQEDLAVELKIALEERGAKAKITEGAAVTGVVRRPTIPEKVRSEVWRRDGGTCVDCGSRERLEFDHIVPFSKGGSNTVRNLELRGFSTDLLLAPETR
jgi:hypothetical protein